MTTDEAYKIERDLKRSTRERLEAHGVILRDGMRGAGEGARQIQMASALADMADALRQLLP